MTEPTATPAPSLGLFARAIGVITAPGETFKRILENPRPMGILFLCCVFTAIGTAGPQMTALGRQTTIDLNVQQTERFLSRSVTPTEHAALEGRAAYTPYITAGSMFFAIPFFTLLFSALYWALFNVVLGGTATVKQVFTVIAHAGVITALGAIAGAPIQLVQGIRSSAGPFNLGALAPMLEPTSFAASFLGMLTFFQLWSTVVTAIGLAVLYRRKTTPIAITLFAVTFLIVGVFAYFLSR